MNWIVLEECFMDTCTREVGMREGSTCVFYRLFNTILICLPSTQLDLGLIVKQSQL
jgi:hypothetical protein